MVGNGLPTMCIFHDGKKRHRHPGVCVANIRDLHPFTMTLKEPNIASREHEEIPDNASHFRDDGATFSGMTVLLFSGMLRR